MVPPGATVPPARLRTAPLIVPWPSRVPAAPTVTPPMWLSSTAPVWVASPTSSVPAEIVVKPLTVLTPFSTSRPVPAWVRFPVPEITPTGVTVSEWS